jgi:F-type H+-transporting ATPase subunit b
VSMWSDLAYRVVNFAVLVIGIYFFAKKPLMAFLKKRQETIKNALAEAEEAKREGERKHQEYEERLGKLDLEIKKLRQAMIEEGEREKARIIAEARQIAEKIKEQARLIAQQELKMATRRVQDETAAMSIKLAEELLKKHLTPKDHERLIDDYIKHITRIE